MPKVTPQLQNLFEGLLQKDPKKRLGSKDTQEIKTHPFFEKINWKAIMNKAIKAPFIPILSSESDISNFDPMFTSSTLESYSEQKQQDIEVEVNQDHFADFEFGGEDRDSQ